MYRVLETIPTCYGTLVAGTIIPLNGVPSTVIKNWIEAGIITPSQKVSRSLTPEPGVPSRRKAIVRRPEPESESESESESEQGN